MGHYPFWLGRLHPPVKMPTAPPRTKRGGAGGEVLRNDGRGHSPPNPSWLRGKPQRQPLGVSPASQENATCSPQALRSMITARFNTLNRRQGTSCKYEISLVKRDTT